MIWPYSYKTEKTRCHAANHECLAVKAQKKNHTFGYDVPKKEKHITEYHLTHQSYIRWRLKLSGATTLHRGEVPRIRILLNESHSLTSFQVEGKFSYQTLQFRSFFDLKFHNIFHMNSLFRYSFHFYLY